LSAEELLDGGAGQGADRADALAAAADEDLLLPRALDVDGRRDTRHPRALVVACRSPRRPRRGSPPPSRAGWPRGCARRRSHRAGRSVRVSTGYSTPGSRAASLRAWPRAVATPSLLQRRQGHDGGEVSGLRVGLQNGREQRSLGFTRSTLLTASTTGRVTPRARRARGRRGRARPRPPRRRRSSPPRRPLRPRGAPRSFMYVPSCRWGRWMPGVSSSTSCAADAEGPRDHGEHAVAGGLRLRRDDGEGLAHERVEQGALARRWACRRGRWCPHEARGTRPPRRRAWARAWASARAWARASCGRASRGQASRGRAQASRRTAPRGAGDRRGARALRRLAPRDAGDRRGGRASRRKLAPRDAGDRRGARAFQALRTRCGERLWGHAGGAGARGAQTERAPSSAKSYGA
jgi:hypothetical protein